MSDETARDLREQINTLKGNLDSLSTAIRKKDVELYALKRAAEPRPKPVHSREIASRNKMADETLNSAEEMETNRVCAWFEHVSVAEALAWTDSKPPGGWPTKHFDFGGYVRKQYGLNADGTALLVEPSAGPTVPPVPEPEPPKTWLDDAIGKIVGSTADTK
jgi:hypothetical protein